MDTAAKILPEKGKRNILITSALPYVNNVPHLGNIVGSVLSADVFSRYNKARGRPTLYVCGTDEYGTATETKALEDGVTPEALCEKYHKIHEEVYEWFEIGFDIFGRTPTKQHTEISQHFFRKLQENNFLEEQTAEQPYCEKHHSFLADRFVEGECPRCHYEDARGDQCDKCGNLLDPFDLIKPRCKIDGATPVPRKTTHIHLLLDKLQPEIEEWVKPAMERGAWSLNGRAITDAWLTEGLKPRGITRDLTWGVPVPLPGFEKKVLYVWFEACIGYPSITANYTTEWEKWWRDPENVRLYQFLGKDNVPFHAVIFPGCEIGTRETWTRLHHLSATEYLNYEDGKFSKSRGVGVFGNNAKDTGIDPDVWRYYLLKNRPEGGDTKFEWRTFIDANNSELLAKLGNLVNRVIKLVNTKSYDSVIPFFSHSHNDFSDVKGQINDILVQYNSELEAVRLRAGLVTAMKIVETGNTFLQSNKLDNKLVAEKPELANNVVGIALNLIYLCSSIFSPYLPATSAKIIEQLNAPFLPIPSPKEDGHPWTPDALKPGHTIGKAKHLFTPIQESKLEEWKAMFGGTQAERLKKEEETAKKAALKAAAKAKKADKKKKVSEGPGPVEASAKGGEEANGAAVAGDPVDAVTDGVKQVTLPTS